MYQACDSEVIAISSLVQDNRVDRLNLIAASCFEKWGVKEIEKVSSIDNSEYWKCPFLTCNVLFEDFVGLKCHFSKQHIPRPYVCKRSSCTWSFPTKSKLERHLQAHDSEKLFKCHYENCKKEFKTTSNLKHHIRKVHQMLNKFPCQLENCTAVFHNQNDLECHRSSHPEALPEHSCHVASCAKSFFTRSALGAHMKAHERKADGWQCNFCGKQYDAQCRLRIHLLSHEGKKPLECLECSMSFVNQSKLNRHMETHSSIRKYICPYDGCGKAFKRNDHLTHHVAMHHLKMRQTKKIRNSTTISILQDRLSCEEVTHSAASGNSHALSEETTESNLYQSSKTESSTPSLLWGSARTSLVYGDILQGKKYRKPKYAPGKDTSQNVIVISNGNRPRAKHILNVSLEETQQSDILPPVEQDLMLSSTSLPIDSSSFSLQEEFNSHDYFLLDSANRLSDFEPSTINLRDLE